VVCLSETAVLELLDGHLADGAGAEEHLAVCAECRRLVSELARTQSGAGRGETRALPGAVVAGRFRLERLLGEGGMGEVWAAQHLVTRRSVAVKLVRSAEDERTRRRVEREARAASAVHHPGILPILDVLELDDGTPALVMELLSGRSLGARLISDGPLPLVEAARLLLPVAEALQAAHRQGVIHRDLKPDNVFLCDDGQVKVLDFGVAKVLAPTEDERLDLTLTGEVVGTPHYMAPEQAFGEADLDGRVDVWALGVTLYECLAGRRPFSGANLGQLLRAVAAGRSEPLGVRIAGAGRLVDRMMAVDRDRRLPMDEVVAELRALSTGGRLRHGARAWALAALVALAAAAASAGLYLSRRERAPAPRPAAVVRAPAPPTVTPEARPAPPAAPSTAAAPARRATVRRAPAESKPPVEERRGPGGVLEEVPF
jgi:serine/threonine-protein kinase